MNYDRPMKTKTVGQLVKAILVMIIAVFVFVFIFVWLQDSTEPNVIVELGPMGDAGYQGTYNHTRVQAYQDQALLLLAMAIKEKEGWKGEDGEDGEVGPLQIRDICLQDFVDHHPQLPIPDRTSLGDSIRVFDWYVTHYGTDKGIGFVELPRLWNGGPNGHTLKDTKEYRDDVMVIWTNLISGEQDG